MHATILSIGDELVSGLTLNSNATWLSLQLTALGITTSAHLTVGDQLQPIIHAIQLAAQNHTNLLLISGGLGPTDDDLTRQALASALQSPLIEDPLALAQLQAWFALRNRSMSPSNRLQILRPQSASILQNSCGTAPGLHATLFQTEIFVVPGVPQEMQEMFRLSILPLLQARSHGVHTRATKINTFGLGESIVGEKIHDLMTRGANPSVGTTVHDGIVSVRIYATGTPDETAAATELLRTQITPRLGPIIFGENETSLQLSLAALLLENSFTLATAESCTGGLLAQLLTSIPGASAFFQRGWITYANQAKIEELSVPESLLAQHGAVSEPVARAMAEGARQKAATHFALAITGLAGPDGTTPEKPVGTVWIALASPTETRAKKFIFPGDRSAIRLRAAQMALALLRWKILNTPEFPPLTQQTSCYLLL